jgi:hypothetical protein
MSFDDFCASKYYLNKERFYVTKKDFVDPEQGVRKKRK